MRCINIMVSCNNYYTWDKGHWQYIIWICKSPMRKRVFVYSRRLFMPPRNRQNRECMPNPNQTEIFLNFYSPNWTGTEANRTKAFEHNDQVIQKWCPAIEWKCRWNKLYFKFWYQKGAVLYKHHSVSIDQQTLSAKKMKK